MSAGAGYDIGLSSSTANATPQSTSAATVFNFNSAGASFDGGYTSAYGPATATATTKSPGATSVSETGNPNDRNPATNPLLSMLGFGNGGSGGLILLGLIIVVGGVIAYKKLS